MTTCSGWQRDNQNRKDKGDETTYIVERRNPVIKW